MHLKTTHPQDIRPSPHPCLRLLLIQLQKYPFMGDECAPAWIPSVTDSAPQFLSALCEGGFICFAPFLVPRHVSNPIDDVEGELCFRYMSEQLVLVR